MEIFESIVGSLDGWLGSAFYFPFLLLGVGLFFTLYLGFPQIRFFTHAWKVVTGKYSKDAVVGDTTHFQALSTALSGTVGTGNIGGVAFAIFLGGPAALFWMWMTAFLGMTTKYVEVTISHRYRVKDAEGHIAGGPMYYMERGLNMRWLAVFFAVAMVVSSFGSGNLPQSNNLAAGIETSFGVPPYVTGLVLSVALGLVIIGGIRRIALVAASIVPLMGILYAIGAFAVALSNFDQIGPSFAAVFRDAFTGSAATGGFLGATFAYAFNRGVNRGLFSNEAGQGSAAVAHAAARTDEPVAEGMVSILEPFIDTLIICTLTGLVILSSGVWTEKFENEFAHFDTEFIAGEYTESNAQHVQELFSHMDIVSFGDDPVQPYTGQIRVADGIGDLAGITVLHNRSIAEDVRFLAGEQPYNGVIDVIDGGVTTDNVTIAGRSLLHSVPLTAEAFKRSFFGEFGQYAVTVGLALFAFSTAIAWSYYGDRCTEFLFGLKGVFVYKLVFLGFVFLGAILPLQTV
ncbi:MAG: amino acid carrier protein, partial [Gammaproteobacteria bacterium]|nr:amino acid carrier protein [Gammaproteobacteria bacterium]